MTYDPRMREPLFTSLFHLALPHMKGYQSDLGHDVLTLAGGEVGDVFLWGWRESGTCMVQITHKGDLADAINVIKGNVQPSENWHVIRIMKKRFRGHADGYIDKIGHVSNTITIENLRNYLDAIVEPRAAHEVS